MRANHHGIQGIGIALVGFVALAGSAKGACLGKSVVGPNGTTHTAHIIAPKGEVDRYKALGFVPQQCDAKLAQLQQAVDNICRMAATTPSSLQAQLARSRGVSLKQLCASGRAGLAEMSAK